MKATKITKPTGIPVKAVEPQVGGRQTARHLPQQHHSKMTAIRRSKGKALRLRAL